MAPKKSRGTPPGFRKTSYEFTEAAKRTLRDLTASLEDDGYQGLAETAVVEALILAAKRTGVDRDVLDRVLRQRRSAYDRAEKAR